MPPLQATLAGMATSHSGAYHTYKSCGSSCACSLEAPSVVVCFSPSAESSLSCCISVSGVFGVWA